MTFNEILEKYIKLTGCTSKELALRSGLSQTAVSRYRNGQRTPSSDLSSVMKLCAAFESIANEKNIPFNRKALENEFKESLSIIEIDYLSFTHRLNRLINLFEINSNDLAKAINYDPSHLSRIKAMKRKPANPVKFAEEIASYVTKRFNSDESRGLIASLTGESESLEEALVHWLLGETNGSDDYLGELLSDLDMFDYTKFFQNEKNKAKAPRFTPLPFRKTFYGLKSIQEAELRFFEELLHSDEKGTVFLHNSLPLSEIMKHMDFCEKWFRIVAEVLNNGTNIILVHDVTRPIMEMRHGIEMWMPLYMSGRITSYYIKNRTHDVFHTMTYVSDNTALIGECIGNNLKDGMYYFTRSKKEVEYFKTKAKNIISLCSPLTFVFKKENRDEFTKYINKYINEKANRYTINSSLPICTISEDLLRRIADRNRLSDEDYQKLLGSVMKMRERVSILLKSNTITENFPIVTREEFTHNPLSISTSGAFLDKTIYYTYEEYVEHLRLTKEFCASHPRFITNEIKNSFKNLTITVMEGKLGVVSKLQSPTIHFTVHQPQLFKAIDNYNKYFLEQNSNIV